MQKREHIYIFGTVILHQIVGFIWYSPQMFANQWMLAVGKTEADLDKGNPAPFLVSIIYSFLFCYFLLWLIKGLNIQTRKESARLGSLLTFVTCAMTLAVHYQFLNFPAALVVIDGGREIILGYLSGAILFHSLKK